MKSVFSSLIFFFLLVSNSILFGQNSDINLLIKINDTYTPNGGKVMGFVTHSVTPVSLGIPSGLLVAGAIKKDRVLIFNGLESLSGHALSGVLTAGLKWGIKRERPFVTYPTEIEKYTAAGSPSFPSGHTSMAFAMATSVSLTYPKWYFIAPAYAYACAVAYSRMYLGVHYPSDLAVGAIIGSGSAFISHYTFKVIKRKWEVNHQKEKL